MTTTPDSLSLFKARVYDILSNRHKLIGLSKIGTLSKEDSAVCTAIGLAAEQLQLESALELAQASFDGIALTFLQIYRDGALGQMQNENMQKVAEIMAKAGADARAAETSDTETVSADQ